MEAILRDAFRSAGGAFAPLYRAFGWVHRAAHILGQKGVPGATVRAQLSGLLPCSLVRLVVPVSPRPSSVRRVFHQARLVGGPFTSIRTDGPAAVVCPAGPSYGAGAGG